MFGRTPSPSPPPREEEAFTDRSFRRGGGLISVQLVEFINNVVQHNRVDAVGTEPSSVVSETLRV